MYRLALIPFLLVVFAPVDVGAADTLLVSHNGVDAANNCLAAASPCKTIGHALALMADGDTVRIAKGTYKESLTIDTAGTRTFEGGWSLDFALRDVAMFKSIWKGSNAAHRALALTAFGLSNTTILDGLSLSGSVFPKGTFESGAAVQGSSGDTFAPAAAGGLHLVLHDVTMNANKADESGGAIALQQSDTSVMTLTITGSQLTNNIGEFTGGAIDLLCTDTAGTMTVSISDSEFSGNDSTDKNFHAGGGAISLVSTCDAATLTLTANQFVNNTAKGQFGSGTSGGGAIRVESDGTGSPTVTLVNNVFQGNKSKGNGGAIAVFGTSPGSVTLYSRNSTFFKQNHAKFKGGGVWLAGNVTADFLNDIMWGGTVPKPGAGRDLASDGVPSVRLTHTDIGNIGTGTVTIDGGGNLSVDPLFKSPTFTIRAGSPMIDAGLCTAPTGPPVPTDDFFDNPRPGPGGLCDIGAVEL